VRKAFLLALVAVALSGCGAAASTAAAPTTAPTYSATVLGDGPVAYWRMGDTSGAIMADQSSHGNSGAYEGGFTLGQPGAIAGDGNTAVLFDGVSGAASVPSSASLQVNNVTIELWMKKQADNEYGVYVAKNVDPGGGAGSGWFQLLNSHHDGHLEFRVTADYPTIVSSQTLALNTWYYVVTTYDGTTAKLFINGKLDSALAVTAIPKQSTDPLYIGRRPDGHFTNALVDEVAIYPTALSADRIAAHWRIATATR